MSNSDVGVELMFNSTQYAQSEESATADINLKFYIGTPGSLRLHVL